MPCTCMNPPKNKLDSMLKRIIYASIQPRQSYPGRNRSGLSRSGGNGVGGLSCFSVNPLRMHRFPSGCRTGGDLAYCNANKIPVFRRDLGGGAVYLDGGQLFFQVILQKIIPRCRRTKRAFIGSSPAHRNGVRRIGIPAAYKPVNDVLAGPRSISGPGSGKSGMALSL